MILLKKTSATYTEIVAFPPPPPSSDAIVDHVFIEKTIQSYFDARRLTYKTAGGIEKMGYFLTNTTEPSAKPAIFMRQTDGEWEPIEDEEWRPFMNSLAPFVIPRREDYSKIVGFMVPFKNKEIVFKMKDLTNLRRNNTGARCDSAGKENVIILLGKIGGEDYKNALPATMRNFSICGITEILLRHFTESKKDEKVWFLDIERAIFNKIEDI
jgi:hypothetical protein